MELEFSPAESSPVDSHNPDIPAEGLKGGVLSVGPKEFEDACAIAYTSTESSRYVPNPWHASTIRLAPDGLDLTGIVFKLSHLYNLGRD
jgi:hypothetical protein